jgi:protein gp37
VRLKLAGAPKYQDGFQFTIHPDALDIPIRWKRSRLIFVNSMSDLFHEEMPTRFLLKVFDSMKAADWHIYQILTKRPQRMLAFTQQYVKDHGPIPDYVWMGVTVEDASCKPRIDLLRQVPVRVRFTSCEPLLSALAPLDLSGISWVIVGGESGPNFRPMNPDWPREVRDECVRQKVPFFFKQWSAVRPKALGRELDEKIWNEYPAGALERLKNRKETVQVKLG